MATPLTLTPAGGIPVTPIASGSPFTIVGTGGTPATVVSSGGLPVTLLNSAGVTYDDSAVALFSAMTAQPTETRAGVINSLFASLRSAGILTKLDFLYILAAHTSQAALLNWISPAAFLALEVNSPTFTTDRGYAGNGTNSYLNTQFTPSANGVNLTQNSATIGVWSRTAAAQASNIFGNGTGAGSLVIGPRVTGDTFNYRVNQGTTAATASTDGTGHFAASRSGASATQGYKNGAAAGAAGSVASGALASVALNIGRAGGAFTSAEVAAAYVGANLSAGEHSSLHAALNTYMTAVGAA